MLSILFHLLFNMNVLYGVIAIAAVGAGIYFTLGPVIFLKTIMDIRTWFVLAAILAVLGFAHGQKQNAELKKEIAAAAQQSTADKGALETTNLRVIQRGQRQQQSTRLQQVIIQAPPGTEEDALLDAIAAERPTYHNILQSTPRQSDAKQAQPSPSATDRAPVLSGGVLRKRPDVVVVP